MLYHFLYPLSENLSFLNIFRYITFRSFIAFTVSFLIALLWGQRFIRFARLKQYGQSIRELGPESHFKKKGTPTFGGVFMLGALFLAFLFAGNFTSTPCLVTLLVTLSYFFLGGIDDYLKIIKKNSDGVSARGKLAWQVVTAAVACFLLIKNGVISTELYIPFYKNAVLDLGTVGYIVFGSLVIVGSSNAVNLTDGLDGLAVGPIITSSACFSLLAYIAGHQEIANYLFIPYVAESSELLVLLAAAIGAAVAFLWFNCHPAQIFMGDVGSLSLGGFLGTIAVITKNEFLFVIIGGIFVVEALSVILQVSYFKLTKKRIFKMAPIHHHFELMGWPEPKVIVRFWLISLILAIFALATLKLR